ncbi:Hypothetical protein GLP15_3465 [Giardia lamblia P15]|uniref:Uncharacterized protein n=1 Tax=Giardia intestinalis (strain P15) TaxID=658858 RepID=E1F0D6_GIAIA|nr:Hypothetical protein GLP15_3465 [Giardia lamblia P15]
MIKILTRNSKMNLIRELGNCTEPPLELLRSLVRLSLHVQLGLRDSSDILSYKPLLRFARERNSEKEELVLRVILQLYLLAMRRHKRVESISDEFIQLIYSLMSEPFPEIYALLLYSTNFMTPVLQKTILQFCSRRLRDSSESPTVRVATLLVVTCTIAKSLDKGVDFGSLIEKFAENYLKSICFPLSSWERVIVQLCLDIDTQMAKVSPHAPPSVTQHYSDSYIFKGLEQVYAETVEFLRLCYAVEHGDSKAYGAIDVFLQTVEHGKILGILGSIEVFQPVTWIINYTRNIARILAFEFGESSKSALLRLIWLLIAAFPDYADLIFTNFFSITNLRACDAYISLEDAAHMKPLNATEDDLQEALLRVVANCPAQLLQRHIEIVALAFTTTTSACMPAIVPFYWDLVPVNRRGITSSQNLRAVVTRLLTASDTEIWIADWLKDTHSTSIICGYIPLIFLQISDKESFTLLYDSLCTAYQRHPRPLECDDGTTISERLCFYDVFILTLSTLSVPEVRSIASSALMENQSLSGIMNLADLDSIALSYSSMEQALLTFSTLAYDKTVFKPIFEIIGQSGDQFLLEDADFLPELITKTIAALEDVNLIVSCVDDGELYTTGTYRLAISCLYYYELLYTVVAGGSEDSKVYVTRDTRRLVSKALTVFKEANHSTIYYSILKMKMAILRLLSMTSVISGLATMFVAVAPTAAVYVLLALFYSCTLLESAYSSGAAASLGVKIFSGPGHHGDDHNSQASDKAYINLQSTVLYHLCTAKDLYYTLFSSNEAIRGGMLRILIFELSAVANIPQTDTVFLSAIHTVKYRNLLRNSISMLIFEGKVIFTPWEKQRLERSLYSLSYTKQAINLYDTDKAKTTTGITVVHESGCCFAGMCAESQLTAIHYAFSKYSKSQLVEEMRAFVKDGISFAYCLQALGDHVATTEFMLAEPVLRYGLLCAVANVSRSADSFNNNELLSLFCDSLSNILDSNLKLACSEQAAIDILTLFQDCLYFFQKNYTPDGFTLTTSQILRLYRTMLMVCIENGLTATNSRAVKLCFVPSTTGLLALLPRVHATLSSKTQLGDLSEVFKSGVISCCLLDFLDAFVLIERIFQLSLNIHRGVQELANLIADLISRLTVSVTRVISLPESSRPLTQTIVVRILNLLEGFIRPFSGEEDVNIVTKDSTERHHSRACLRMVDYQHIGALSIGNLLSFMDCPAVIVSEGSMQICLCYVFSRLYQSFLQYSMLSVDDTELFYKAMLSTALHLQECKKGCRGVEYFYVHITVLLTHMYKIVVGRLNLLPRSDSDIPRATCLATNQILDGLLEHSLALMASMREVEGTFNETYMLAEKSVFLTSSIPSKAYITCLLMLLQRKNPAAALKGSHLENAMQILYALYRRADSKTASIRQENHKLVDHSLEHYILLADILFCFITGCEGGSIFVSRFFSQQLGSQMQAHSDEAQPALELDSYGYTLILGLLNKVSDVATWEISSEHPRTAMYIHRLVYICYILIIKHMKYEHVETITKQKIVTTFLRTLMKTLASVFSVIKPKDILDLQTQFMLLEIIITLVGMLPLPASAYPNSLPPEAGPFYIQLLDFINGLATLHYTACGGTSVQNNEDDRMLLYASSLAAALMCPQLMTHAVMSKCNQCSSTIRQYLTKNRATFGQSGVDVAILSFICLARNCIDDRNDLKGDIFPAVISQTCRGIFKL